VKKSKTSFHVFMNMLSFHVLAIVVVFYLVANGWFAQTQGHID